MKKRILSLIVSLAMILTGVFGSVTTFAADAENMQISTYAGDSADTATNISFGTTYSGAISGTNKNDFYKFTLPTSGRINLTATSEAEYISYKILDATGKQVWSAAPHWDTTSKVSSTSGTWDFTQGIYYFVVGQSSSRNGDYSFNISFESANETFTETGLGNNNTLSDANFISFNKNYLGQIAKMDNQDCYKFTMPSSGKLTLTANAKMEYIKYEVYDETGKSLWYATPHWNSTSKVSSTEISHNLTKGVYYLAVGKSSDRTGNYSFKLTFDDAKESFEETGNGTNNSAETANNVSWNTQYNGQIAKNDAADFYKVTLSSSGRMKLSANAGTEYIYYKIYDEAGNELWKRNPHWNSTSGMSSVEEIVDLTKGTYYIAVAKYNSYTGNYSFNLTFAGAGESFGETGNGTNNAFGNANNISLNNTYKGQIALNDKSDFYKFTVPSVGKVNLTATAGIQNIYYRIYDAAGKQVWYKSLSWNSTTHQIETNENIDLPQGNYYFVVEKRNNYTGNYSFKFAPAHVHSYKNVVTKATLSSDGKIVRKCSCGDIASTATIYSPKTFSLSTTKYTYSGKTKTPTVTVKDSNGNTISANNYDVSYASGRTNVGTYAVKITFKGNYSGSKTLYFTIVPKSTPSVSATLYGYDDVKVKWEKASGATSYRVYYKKSTASSYTYYKTTTSTSCTKSSLSDGAKYYFKVVACKTVDGKRYESSSKTDYIYTLKKVSTPRLSKSGTKVKVRWTNISGESGYQISKSTSKTGTNIVSTYNTSSGTYKYVSATKGKYYYYKVRAYKTVGGKKIYGPWSTAVRYKR